MAWKFENEKAVRSGKDDVIGKEKYGIGSTYQWRFANAKKAEVKIEEVKEVKKAETKAENKKETKKTSK